MDMNEARELINGPLWSAVRDRFLATGEFAVYPAGDMRRLEYLDEGMRRDIARWREAFAHTDEWKRIVDGSRVRALKAEWPGIYPEIFRLMPYFEKYRAGGFADEACVKLLLKLKFPAAYALCFT